MRFADIKELRADRTKFIEHKCLNQMTASSMVPNLQTTSNEPIYPGHWLGKNRPQTAETKSIGSLLELGKNFYLYRGYKSFLAHALRDRATGSTSWHRPTRSSTH